MMGIWTFLIIPILIISGEGCKTCSRYVSRGGIGRSRHIVSSCVEPKHICDGIEYCANGEDETFCDQSNPRSCPSSTFKCPTAGCAPKKTFCDGVNNCGDNSDEFYCDEMGEFNCPRLWRKCEDGRRCIQSNWWCDGTPDCTDSSDESNCTTPAPVTTTSAPSTSTAMSPVVIKKYTLNEQRKIYRNVQWLLKAVRGKRSFELPRAVLALFLASPRIFAPENRIGSELRDRLTIRILSQVSRNTTIRSQELALYVQALLVVCEDPRDFYGRDLVSELRARVDQPSAYTNPFEILALCNAGGNVTTRDVDRVSAAFDSQHRPFWTDVQAMATMAMQCLSSKVTVGKRVVRDMQNELKKRQFRDGTVENFVTTALVMQALGRNGSSMELLILNSTLKLVRTQREDGSWGGSIRNSFYVLPALSKKSFLDIGHAHCPQKIESEEESLARLQESGGGRWVVQYSVWLGSDVDLGRTWRLRVPSNKNTSFYDVLEMVSKLDSRHNVTYQVVDGKPYVRSLLGKEDDPELGIFWFTYVRPTSSSQPLTLMESSPADLMVNPNQELIMWYKPNTWREESSKEA